MKIEYESSNLTLEAWWDEEWECWYWLADWYPFAGVSM